MFSNKIWYWQQNRKMRQDLITKIQDMTILKRQLLFTHVEMFHNQLILKRHEGVDLGDFCNMCKEELNTHYNLKSHDVSDLYKFTKDNMRSNNLYKSFRDEYLKN